MSTRLLIVAFHEIAINYELELKSQLFLSDISTNYNVGLPRSLHFKLCQMIYLFKTLIMLRSRTNLVISLKHNIIFAKSTKIPLDNNVTFSHTNIRWQSKNHSEIIWVYIFRFFIKGTFSPKSFKKCTGKIQGA